MSSAESPGGRASRPSDSIRIIDLGRTDYHTAYQRQCDEVAAVLASRAEGKPHLATILLVEHPPTITVSRRPGARNHLIATPDMLQRAGVQVVETDRGGDITYHGPGQLVAYPICDLNRLNLRLHDYMRLLEQAIIDTCAAFNLPTHRDKCATGVWVSSNEPDAQARVACAPSSSPSPSCPQPGASSKIAALGVRVRQWVSMHGLALNVTTNLDHFNLIVPCGLTGRTVTSLQAELGDRCPPMSDVKSQLTTNLSRLLSAKRAES